MKKTYVTGAVTGMGFGFPVTLLCMTLFGGYNEVVRELLIWMAASALYGVLSVVLWDQKNDMPQMAVLGLHFVGVTVITMAAAYFSGYVSGIADVVPILIPAVTIYAVITAICYALNKQTEKEINRKLEAPAFLRKSIDIPYEEVMVYPTTLKGIHAVSAYCDSIHAEYSFPSDEEVIINGRLHDIIRAHRGRFGYGIRIREK